jgi:hypothetical protein
MKNIEELETQVLRVLLAGDEPTLVTLRQQAAHARVCRREMTGVGFFTEFDVPHDVPRVPHNPSFKIGDVNGTAENVKNGIGFLLYVEGGKLSMLEGYTYDDPWPEDVCGLVLQYSTQSARDLNALRQTLQDR